MSDVPAQPTKSKTRATRDAVFDYCNELKARSFKGDYCQTVAAHFNAGNSTVTPHIKAWRATLPSVGSWPMDESTQAAANSFVSQIWDATCELAQHKLAVETLDLKTKLRNAEEIIAQYSTTYDELTGQLALEKENTVAQANDAYKTASELAGMQEELREARKSLQAFEALKVEHEMLHKQLRETELKFSKLEGKYEAMMEKRGAV
ncbi:MAG: DNA-binding protein [Comamonas sp.]|nr:DNA-binding protein [Comamonas sp.]